MDPTLLLSIQAGAEAQDGSCVGETANRRLCRHSDSAESKEQEGQDCVNSYSGDDRRSTLRAASERLLACKSRSKTDRLTQMSRAGGGGGGRELINSLREYFASRNVINRTERYEKFDGGDRNGADSETKLLRGPSEGQTESVGATGTSSSGDHCAKIKMNQGQSERGRQTPKSCPDGRPTRSWLAYWPSSQASTRPLPNREGAHYFITTTRHQNQSRPEHLSNEHHQRQHHHHHQQQQQQQQQQVKKFNYNCNSSTSGGPMKHKHGVCQLVKELFRAKRNNKLLLVMKLLRAPIVLAALFSFALAISLITLYTLSFHHCNHLQTKRQHHDQRLNKSGEGAEYSKVLQQVKPRDGDKIVFEPSNVSQTSEREAEFAGNIPTAASASADEEMSHAHVINSRQLAAAADSRRQQQLESRADDRVESDINEVQQPYQIETECATYLGRPDSSPSGAGLVFAGIPYASPPINERRWRRPRPVWLDKRLCNRNKRRAPVESQQRAHCVQLSPFNRRVSGSEDCLYLDVYTPMSLSAVKGQTLPVMVYIHGGLLAFGSSGHGQVNWMKARPSGQLATAMNVVLVAPNYRLQALGFMALRELAQINGPDGSEGNYGLWDQLVALNWIRRNIGSFGGNASNINLFGPDSASALPLALLSRRRRPDKGQADALGGQTGETGEKKGQQPHSRVQSVAGETIALGNETIGSLNKLTATSGRQGRRRADDVEGPVSTGGSSSSLDGQLRGRRASSPMKSSSHNLRPTCASDGRQDDYCLETDPSLLFRSVWLTNPSVYFGLPYERANGHYSRLIKSQSVCSTAARGDESDDANGANSPNATIAVSRSPLVDGANGKKLIECLMNLSAEQVVREYLGKDDPAFRLDDENSLPIRNIYPDQFVTVDGQLVHDSYPFDGAIAANEAAAADEKVAAAPRRQVATNDEVKGGGRIKFLIGTTAQAVEYWPCPRNLHQWNWLDLERYAATSLNSFSQDTYMQASGVYRLPRGAASKGQASNHTVDLGDTADATNVAGASESYNPIERYLTMVTDIRQTCPSHKLSDSLARLMAVQGSSTPSLVERYIVEWRPSSRLTQSMSPTVDRNGARRPLQPVRSRPHTPCKLCDQKYADSMQTNAKVDTAEIDGESLLKYEQQSDEDVDGGQASGYIKPPMKYAFHHWDLLAFFGFEFDTGGGGGDVWTELPSMDKRKQEEMASRLRPVGLEVTESDLNFQRLLRKMVRDFVHGQANELVLAADAFGSPVSGSEPGHASGYESNSRPKQLATYYSGANFSTNSARRRGRRGVDDGTRADGGRNTIPELAAGSTGEAGDISNETKAQSTFVLFTLDNKMKRKLGEYKRVECNMWHQLLKQSYAWIS